MSKKDKKKQETPSPGPEEVLEPGAEEAGKPAQPPQEEPEEPEVSETPVEEPREDGGKLSAAVLSAELESAKARLAGTEDKLVRLAAEFDNYRKRTARELEGLKSAAAGETAAAFLPVYDNLERALKQETADAAFKKGVEMTMNQLKEIFAKLGILEIPALGQPFDPKLHNAISHVEDPELGEDVVTEVFQAGFMQGDKVIRFAMVQVAN